MSIRQRMVTVVAAVLLGWGLGVPAYGAELSAPEDSVEAPLVVASDSEGFELIAPDIPHFSINDTGWGKTS